MNNMLTIYVESVIHINFFFIIHGKIGGGEERIWYNYSRLHKVCSCLDEVCRPCFKCGKMYL